MKLTDIIREYTYPALGNLELCLYIDATSKKLHGEYPEGTKLVLEDEANKSTALFLNGPFMEKYYIVKPTK
jgi:hypothetical protein